MAVDISPFIQDAQKLQDLTGIPASITLGQIILESSGSNPGGLSGLGYYAKNLFGIKGTGTAGSYYVPTKEFMGGRMVTVNASFRKYNSYYESMYDHALLLSKPRYQVHLANAKTVNDYAAGIKAGGYATDPNYVSKLLGVIGSHNLNQYDKGKFNYTPIAGALPEGGGGAAAPGSDPKTQFSNSLMFGVSRAVLILGFGIVGVIFFLKAFPTTSDIVDAVNPVTKANVIKGVKNLAKQ